MRQSMFCVSVMVIGLLCLSGCDGSQEEAAPRKSGTPKGQVEIPIPGGRKDETRGMPESVKHKPDMKPANAEQQAAVSIPPDRAKEVRRVKVATPEGIVEKEIAFYKNTIGMEFVLIPPGEFMMGSPATEKQRCAREGPQHRVRITKPFYMGAYEVTQEQYENVMGKYPAYFNGPRNPVELVSWHDAVEFCKRLSQRDGVAYRLPTEAQWEYACRAGTTTPFYVGNTISTDQANYHGRSTYGNGRKGVHRGRTTAVGSFAPNAWGLYDMPGNVWEWCQDWFAEDYYGRSPADDPTGPATGQSRVLRGGSWFHVPWYLRSANRSGVGPAFTVNFGFRIVFGPKEQLIGL